MFFEGARDPGQGDAKNPGLGGARNPTVSRGQKFGKNTVERFVF